jgi:signal transduction histidine kinase
MQWSYRLEKLAKIVEDVQVELKRLIRELERVSDDDLGALAYYWARDLDEAYGYLEEAKDIMLSVAEDMRREGV